VGFLRLYCESHHLVFHSDSLPGFSQRFGHAGMGYSNVIEDKAVRFFVTIRVPGYEADLDGRDR
jgi:hypothetical protein